MKWICIEQGSLNECILNAGHWLLYIPDKSEPDTNRESDTMTYTEVHCQDVIFKWGMFTLSTMLDILISMLEYIYSIVCRTFQLCHNRRCFVEKRSYCSKEFKSIRYYKFTPWSKKTIRGSLGSPFLVVWIECNNRKQTSEGHSSRKSFQRRVKEPFIRLYYTYLLKRNNPLWKCNIF
jgi:hypothetical protein